MNLGDFKSYFYIRSSIAIKSKQDELVPVYLRIEKNRKRKDISTNVHGPKHLWNAVHKRFDGKANHIKIANRELEAWSNKVDLCYSQLLRTKGSVELEEFYTHLTGKFEEPMLLETFRKRISVIEGLIGKKYAAGTLTTYKVAFKHLIAFVQQSNTKDIALRDVTVGFLNGFSDFLIQKMTVNSANKNMRKLKAVLNDAGDHETFDASKLKKISIKDEEVTREFLTEGELKGIAAKKFTIERVAIVRDIFLFQCYTGLAYADINGLTTEFIHRSSDRFFVIKPREKTKINARIPLVPEAVELLDKYSTHRPNGKCFPIPSNQKFNAYLQEVADLCGITKPLTSHIARHTFATRMLNNGMPKDVLQEIMGLSSAKHLGIYAKMQKETLHDAMMKANSRNNDGPFASYPAI